MILLFSISFLICAMVNHCHTGNVMEMEWNMWPSSSPSVFNAWGVCSIHKKGFTRNITSSSPYGVHFVTAKGCLGSMFWGSALPLQSVYLHNAQPLENLIIGLGKKSDIGRPRGKYPQWICCPFYPVQEPYETACLHGWGWVPTAGGTQKGSSMLEWRGQKGSSEPDSHLCTW